MKSKYDEMHKAGVSSWFSQGEEERQLILKMGEPWEGLQVLEIGCGEGDLANTISELGNIIWAVDYSQEAIDRAIKKYPDSPAMFGCKGYATLVGRYDRIVMQGVLEHLDDPFTELKWMMDNLLTEKGDVITSSPCFLNPRGIVWMTLDMLGAVMSKTDLHYLNPWEFEEFCEKNDYGIEIEFCDSSWGNGRGMIEDFRKRLPLALGDGGIKFKQSKINKFLEWLDLVPCDAVGATAVYRITK